MRYELRSKIYYAIQKGPQDCKKQGKNIDELFSVVEKLANDIPLEAKYRDHSLSGNYTSYRECHIELDWLLVYRKEDDILVLLLYRVGSHSELF